MGVGVLANQSRRHARRHALHDRAELLQQLLPASGDLGSIRATQQLALRHDVAVEEMRDHELRAHEARQLGGVGDGFVARGRQIRTSENATR